MIQIDKLLPSLTAKERKAFQELCADYRQGCDDLNRYGRNACRARKDEIQSELKRTTDAEKRATLVTELNDIDEKFKSARKAVRHQFCEQSKKHLAVLSPLVEKAIAYADELIEKATTDYARHFSTFGAEPAGESPVVTFLRSHRAALEGKRLGLAANAAWRETGTCAPPSNPADVLPYTFNPEHELV